MNSNGNMMDQIREYIPPLSEDEKRFEEKENRFRRDR